MRERTVNATAAREELSAVSAEVNAILDPVRDGRFIVFHDANNISKRPSTSRPRVQYRSEMRRIPALRVLPKSKIASRMKVSNACCQNPSSTPSWLRPSWTASMQTPRCWIRLAPTWRWMPAFTRNFCGTLRTRLPSAFHNHEGAASICPRKGPKPVPRRLSFILLPFLGLAVQMSAHPHLFVDLGVGFHIIGFTLFIPSHCLDVR